MCIRDSVCFIVVAAHKAKGRNAGPLSFWGRETLSVQVVNIETQRIPLKPCLLHRRAEINNVRQLAWAELLISEEESPGV